MFLTSTAFSNLLNALNKTVIGSTHQELRRNKHSDLHLSKYNIELLPCDDYLYNTEPKPCDDYLYSIELSPCDDHGIESTLQANSDSIYEFYSQQLPHLKIETNERMATETISMPLSRSVSDELKTENGKTELLNTASISDSQLLPELTDNSIRLDFNQLHPHSFYSSVSNNTAILFPLISLAVVFGCYLYAKSCGRKVETALETHEKPDNCLTRLFHSHKKYLASKLDRDDECHQNEVGESSNRFSIMSG